MPATIADLVLEDLAAELDRAKVSEAALLDALADLAIRDYLLESMTRDAYGRAARADALVARLRKQLADLTRKTQAAS